jgi:hypothetical protein
MIGNSGARWFLGTVFLLLVVTAAAKVVSAFEGTPLLARYDTLLPLSVRQTLLLAAAVECACALVVLMRGLERVSCLVVACLGGGISPLPSGRAHDWHARSLPVLGKTDGLGGAK